MSNKMKDKKYHPVETVPKSYWKIVETEVKLISLTHIHNQTLSWLGICISMVRLWVQTSLLLKWCGRAKCFPHVSNMQTVT